MKEDGVSAGYRRIGTFFLWTIPLSLGAAACVWLGFAMATHDWFNQLSQEKRRAIYTGAAVLPKSALKILTPNEGCIKITKVDLDGSTAAVYLRNECGQTRKGIVINWHLISPNGTFIASESQYVMTDLPAEATAEMVFDGRWHGIKLDKRAESIQFTANEGY